MAAAPNCTQNIIITTTMVREKAKEKEAVLGKEKEVATKKERKKLAPFVCPKLTQRLPHTSNSAQPRKERSHTLLRVGMEKSEKNLRFALMASL